MNRALHLKAAMDLGYALGRGDKAAERKAMADLMSSYGTVRQDAALERLMSDIEASPECEPPPQDK